MEQQQIRKIFDYLSQNGEVFKMMDDNVAFVHGIKFIEQTDLSVKAFYVTKGEHYSVATDEQIRRALNKVCDKNWFI